MWFVQILARNTVDTGQVSKQMDDALKMQKSMKAAERKRQKEAEIERVRNLVAAARHARSG